VNPWCRRGDGSHFSLGQDQLPATSHTQAVLLAAMLNAQFAGRTQQLSARKHRRNGRRLQGLRAVRRAIAEGVGSVRGLRDCLGVGY